MTPHHAADKSGKKKRLKISSIRNVAGQILLPRWKLLTLGLLLIAVNRLAGLVLPGSTQYLIDTIIGEKQLEDLPIFLGVVFGAVTLQGAAGFATTRLLSVQAQRLIADLRTRVQRHVIRLPLEKFDASRSGELVSRIMTDVEGVRNLVGTGLVQLVGGLLTAIVAFFLLIEIHVVLTFAGLVPLFLFAGISTFAFKRIRPVFRERGKLNAEVTGRLTESLGGIRVVKGFDAEAREEAVFAGGVNRLFDNVRKTLTATSLVMSLATFLMGVTSVVLMGIAAGEIADGALSVGQFFAFTLYMGFLVSPVVQMASIGTQITEAFAGLDRTEELLSEPREEDDPRRAVKLDHVHGGFEFENVSFEYKSDEPVLRNISLSIAPGSTVALVGSSGSGKSTLAGLAASFREPTAGRVLVDGVDLCNVDLKSYRSQLGVVLQDDFLFDGTIKENLLFARPEATDADIAAATASAHVDEFVARFELGLETVIGERGVRLSGGQRQRVAIARAILADPRVLILDEATSSLDTESEALIQDAFARLLQGRTTFVIAHRLSTIRKANPIVVLEEGRIVEMGTHDELIANGSRYFDLYTHQARI